MQVKYLGVFAAISMAAWITNSAQAQTISTLADGNSSVFPWSLPLVPTFGQTITIASRSSLGNVTFRIDDGGNLRTFDFRVFAWDAANTRATGPSLAAASGQTAGVDGTQSVVVDAGGAVLPSAGEYIVFFHATDASNTSEARWSSANDNPYSGGQAFSQFNGGDASQWTTDPWTPIAGPGWDFVFEFVLVPFSGPTADEELATLITTSGAAGRLIVVDGAGNARDMGEVSLATRAQRPAFTGVAASERGLVPVMSSQGAPGMIGNLYTWVQVTGFDSAEDDGPGNVSGGGLQIGADLQIGPGMVAGLSLGHNQISGSDGSTSQDGTQTFLQPYFAYGQGPWHGNASLMVGRGDYDQTSIGGDGTGETRLWAVTLEGGYDLAMGDALIVTPTLGLIHGRTTVEGTGGTLAGAGSQDYDFTQASLGAEVSYDIAQGSVFAGLHADHLTQNADTVLTGDLLSEDGWSGRIELGGTMQLSNGLDLAASVELGGLGGGARTVSGGLRLGWTF